MFQGQPWLYREILSVKNKREGEREKEGGGKKREGEEGREKRREDTNNWRISYPSMTHFQGDSIVVRDHTV